VQKYVRYRKNLELVLKARRPLSVTFGYSKGRGGKTKCQLYVRKVYRHGKKLGGRWTRHRCTKSFHNGATRGRGRDEAQNERSKEVWENREASSR